MSKMLVINENTVIKLYEKHVKETHVTGEVSTIIMDEIMAKLSKTDKPHPLKEIFLHSDDKRDYYELIHFVFSTVEEYARFKTIKLKNDPKRD